MPTCRDMSELVTDYLEGDLPPRIWLGARWHLVLCGACRTYFAQMRATVGLLGRLPRQPPPPAAEDRALAGLPPDPGKAP